LPPGTCELAKMYLVPEVRGKGLGKRLINECLQFAKDQGFEKVYLETMPELRSALIVYEKTGFQYLPGPLGNSGHFGCSLWMLRNL
jgi:putative acetyltransferase